MASWDGSWFVGSRRSHCEAAGVHLFCLHAAKDIRSGAVLDLVRGKRRGGGHTRTLHSARAESPTIKSLGATYPNPAYSLPSSNSRVQPIRPVMITPPTCACQIVSSLVMMWKA